MKKYFFLFLLALALLFAACEINVSVPSYTPENPGVPNNTPRQFWAQDVRNSSFYSLEARKLAEGDYCTVWAETGNRMISVAVAESMARTYDTDIYPKMKAVFGIDNIEYQGFRFRDTMELADAFGDEDGKLCILFLDIRDGYNPSTSVDAVVGYFHSLNFIPNSSPYLPANMKYSNECDMIYMDTYPGEPGSPTSNETLAHELQHLMNFVNSQVFREGNNTDTWLTEGLSMAAEWVYTGTVDATNIAYYNSAQSPSRISTGNNFFVWDQYGDGSTYDEYATVYLFFQWLRLQSGGNTNIYRTISSSSHSDYNAVVGAMNGYNEWGTMLKTWLAANYINAPNGRYGYMNENTLKNVRARTVTSGIRSVNLYPGEGVYSVTNSSGNTPGSRGNIRYAGLSRSTGDVNDTAVFASGALLTYNIDTNLESRPEAGTTTGVAASVSTVPESLFVGTGSSRPSRVSASDMLRRNGYEEVIPPTLRLNPGVNDN